MPGCTDTPYFAKHYSSRELLKYSLERFLRNNANLWRLKWTSPNSDNKKEPPNHILCFPPRDCLSVDDTEDCLALQDENQKGSTATFQQIVYLCEQTPLASVKIRIESSSKYRNSDLHVRSIRWNPLSKPTLA